MRKNIGKMDQLVRFSIAIVLSILAYAKIIPQQIDIAVYVVSFIIAITGFVRVCPDKDYN